MKTTCITCVNGNIGTFIATKLSSEKHFVRIFGIDKKAPNSSLNDIEYLQSDILIDDLSVPFNESDIILHLAFVVGPSKDPVKAEKINVEGTKRAIHYFNNSPKANLFVFLSSASVYGLHEDNPLPLNEDHTPRPDYKRIYQKSKFLCERLLMEEIVREKRWVILRPSLIFSHNFDNFLLTMTRSKYIVKLKNFNPLFQLLHIEDLYSAILQSFNFSNNLLLNVSPDDYISLSDCALITNKKVINIPLSIANIAITISNKIGLVHLNTSDLNLWKYSIVIDNTKIKSFFNWSPLYSTKEIILGS